MRLQQLEAEGCVGEEECRTYMLLTLMIKLVMALVVGVLTFCSFLII